MTAITGEVMHNKIKEHVKIKSHNPDRVADCVDEEMRVDVDDGDADQSSRLDEHHIPETVEHIPIPIALETSQTIIIAGQLAKEDSRWQMSEKYHQPEETLRFPDTDRIRDGWQGASDFGAIARSEIERSLALKDVRIRDACVAAETG